MHGVAHADSEGFFVGAFPASPSQPAIAEAIGAACAAVSQNGPNRPRSSTASIASAAMRIIPLIGRAWFIMLAIRLFEASRVFRRFLLVRGSQHDETTNKF